MTARIPVRSTVMTLLLLIAAGANADARFDYLLFCAGCHLENGSGAPPNVPDLRLELGRFVQAPAGRAYVTRVPGSSQAPISDARLADVLNWMVATFLPEQERADYQPFVASEVGQWRSKALRDPMTFRRMLIKGPVPAPDADL